MKNILKVSPLSDDISVQWNNSYFKLNLIFEVDLNIASSTQCKFRLAKTRAEERTRKCHQAGKYVRKDTFTFTTNQYISFAYNVCPSTRNYKILCKVFFFFAVGTSWSLRHQQPCSLNYVLCGYIIITTFPNL